MFVTVIRDSGKKNMIYFVPWNGYVDATELQCPEFRLGATCYVSVSFQKECTGQTCRFVLSDVAEIV
jgi:hypothetical protein